MARLHIKPRLIFMRCTDFLVEKRIQIPGLQRLSELILSQLSEHKSDLMQLVDMHLSSDLRVTLEDLFAQEGEEKRYRLTLLKRISQSIRPAKIREAVADLEVLAQLYRQIAPVIDNVGLTPEGIRYFAGGVRRGEIFQLRRRSQADRHLHAIAFIVDQHHRLQDALVDMLLSIMQSFETTVSREHKEDVFERRKTDGKKLERILDAVDNKVLSPLREIRDLVEHETLSDAQKLEGIRNVLEGGQESVVDHLRNDLRRRARQV